MNIKPKGGKGKTAPYETAMVRCPVPVKLEVESLIQAYRESILTGKEWGVFQPATEQSEPQVKGIEVKVTKEEAIAKAQKLSKSKRPLPQYVMELIDFIYEIS